MSKRSSSEYNKNRSKSSDEDEDEGDDESEYYKEKPNKKRKKKKDYCCEPPERDEYCPLCICIPAPEQEPGGQQPEDNNNAQPCIPVCCRPCPYWEREIVKFDPTGKWDPQIEEKGQSGHPNLNKDKDKKEKNRKGQGSNKKGRNNNQESSGGQGKKKKKCREDQEDDPADKFVAIGEPCNAYKCYKDPCVPQGMAYCTPKHPKKVSNLPPCPQKFPIKPVRLQLCPIEQKQEGPNQNTFNNYSNNASGNYNNNSSGNHNNASGNYNNAAGNFNNGGQDCCDNNAPENDDCLQDSSLDPFRSWAPRRNLQNNQQDDCNEYSQQQQQFQQISQQQQDCPNCAAARQNPQNFNYPSRDGSSRSGTKKSKIPDEWIQPLPVCDDKKAPNLGEKPYNKGKGSSNNNNTKNKKGKGKRS